MSYTNPGPAVTTGSTLIGQGSPVMVGTDENSLVGFYGVDPVVQSASAAQAALTLTTATTGGMGFSTATAFNDFIAQLENIRATLVAIGIMKGSA